MKIDEVLNFFGNNISRIVRTTKLHSSSITYWKKLGYIPLKTQTYLEVITDGELKTDKKLYAIIERTRSKKNEKNGTHKENNYK